MYLYYLSRYVLVSKPFVGLEQFNILIENFKAEMGGFNSNTVISWSTATIIIFLHVIFMYSTVV